MENIIKELVKSRPISFSFSQENDNSVSTVKNLKILQTSEDLSIFNVGSVQSAEFYSTLQDLLSESGSDEVVCNVLAVLHLAVRNPSARWALTHTYNFIPTLADLLNNNLSNECKISVLSLIRVLSRRGQWRGAGLPRLLGTLRDIIMDDSEPAEVLAVSLGVLANLCHGNKTVVGTLIASVDSKLLIRRIVNFQQGTKHPDMRIQVCKLLMILDQFSGIGFPTINDKELLDSVRVLLLEAVKACKTGNCNLMGHIVDFLHEAKDNDRASQVISTSSSYQPRLEQLVTEMNSLEVPGGGECVSRILDLVRELVLMEARCVLPLCNRVAQCAARWLALDYVAPSALRVLCSIVRWTHDADEAVYGDVVATVENFLPTLVELLHEWVNAESNKTLQQEPTVCLLQLLRALIADDEIASKIASLLDKEELKKLLSPLLSPENSNNDVELGNKATNLYVEVLCLISALSRDDKEWLFLYADLLQKEEIMRMCAIALFYGSCEVKKQVLHLAGTSSFYNECLADLSKYLVLLNEQLPFPPFQPNTFDEDKLFSARSDPHLSPSRKDLMPLLTRKQARGVDSLIEKFGELAKNKKLEQASVAGIVELYQYQLGETQRSERNMRVESARLTRRSAQLSAETVRLYHSLHAQQVALDGYQSVVRDLRKQLRAAEVTETETQTKFKQLTQDCTSKGIIIKSLTEEMEQLKETNEDYKSKCEQFEETIARLKNLTEELSKDKTELLSAKTELQNSLKLQQEAVQGKDEAIKGLRNEIESLEEIVADLRMKNEVLKKSIKEKEDKLAIQQNQLLELERMRKLIFDITTSKKH